MKLIIDIPEDVYMRLKDDEHMIRDVVEKFGGTASTQANLAILKGALYEEHPIGNKWHDLRENTNDLPTTTRWYVCKVKSSHDLRLVFGYEDVTIDKFDAWLEVTYE